jgi:four helix bundle protein
MADFKNLKVWEKAHRFSVDAVRASVGMNGVAGSHLKNQFLRSAMSIPANIAEGSAKQSDREFARFVRIALGSATETENHLLLARDLKLIDSNHYESLNQQIQDIRKMLTGLAKRLSSDADGRGSAPRSAISN